MHREKMLRDAGFDVVSIWESDFNLTHPIKRIKIKVI